MIYKRKNHSNLIINLFVTIVFGFILFFFSLNSYLKLFAEEKKLFEIEDYFNSIRTLESEFVQESYTSLISTGTFFLKKPGKFRFSYNPPTKLEVVSHLQAVLVFDPKNNRTGPLTYPISSSPFKYLLEDKFEISSKSFSKISTQEDILFVELNLGNEGKNSLTLKLNKNPIKLTGWELENNFGEVTKVFLSNIRVNRYVSDQIFNLDEDYKILKNR